MQLQESSLQDLFQSAVDAFPGTTKRQYAIDPVVVKHLHWMPYVGMKTLFVRSLVESNGKEYEPLLLFKGIRYGEKGIRLASCHTKNDLSGCNN